MYLSSQLHVNVKMRWIYYASFVSFGSYFHLLSIWKICETRVVFMFKICVNFTSIHFPNFHLKFRLDFHMIFMFLNIHDFHMKSTLMVYRGGASFQKHPRGFEQRRKINLQWNTNARWCTRPVVRKSRSRRAESAFQDCSIVLMAR